MPDFWDIIPHFNYSTEGSKLLFRLIGNQNNTSVQALRFIDFNLINIF